MARRVLKCALLRSSVALIFDTSYGVHCVAIKDGDNLEMPPSIYTCRVSMRESRLDTGERGMEGRQKKTALKTEADREAVQKAGKRMSCV